MIMSQVPKTRWLPRSGLFIPPAVISSCQCSKQSKTVESKATEGVCEGVSRRLHGMFVMKKAAERLKSHLCDIGGGTL